MEVKMIHKFHITPNVLFQDENENVYVASKNTNVLARIRDFSQKICNTEKLADYTFSFRDQMFSSILCHKNFIFFIPYNSDSLYIYSKSEKKIDECMLPSSIIGRCAKYMYGVDVGADLMLFGAGIDHVHFYNIPTGIISEKEKLNDDITSIIGSNKWEIYDGICFNNHLQLVTKKKAVLIDVDLNTYDVKERIIDHSHSGYLSISLFGNKAIVSPNGKNNFFLIDMTNFEAKELPFSGESDDWSYYCKVKKNHNVFYFPFNGNTILRFDFAKEEMKKILTSMERDVNIKMKALSAISVKDSILIAVEDDDEIVIFDDKENMFKRSRIVLNNCRFHNDILMLYENNGIRLENFIELI